MTISNIANHGLAEIVAEHRALEVLRSLNSDILGGRTNTSVLEGFLRLIALCRRTEDLSACLQMLERNGLVRLRQVDEVTIVELSDKGERVAIGEERVEGIARPSRDSVVRLATS